MSSSAGTPIQTYITADFDTTGLFNPTAQDTTIFSHEIAEGMDNPFSSNLTPAWKQGNQVQEICNNIIEVADPLVGAQASPIHMPNGFTYHLDELAFFSWFMGKPSLGIHGWFSNNATFLTEAPSACLSSASESQSAATSKSKIFVVR